MGYKLTFDEFNEVLKELSKENKIYAPKCFPKQGRYSDTDVIRYDKIKSAEEIVFDLKSTYAAKEVYHPITETVLYFNDGDYKEKRVTDDRPIIIFARACDIHAIERFDEIFLKNGGFEDYYYKRVREKVKFVVMECPTNGWDTCFCVSMGTNKTDNYIFGVKVDGDSVSIEIKDEEFSKYFENQEKMDFNISFVEENVRKVRIPNIDTPELRNKVKNLDMWKEFDKRCLMCGSCTVACSTCTCFTTYDVNYTPDSDAGERRRITASCHVDGYSDMAGGHSFRRTAGERMRFKVMHKIHDHMARFKTHNMCVGCGRCDDRCPVFISFSTTVNRLADEVDKLKRGEE
ncbi:anaerobic sulfite reductase subunit AsrA [Fusobacterium sp. SYSU M8D902]|uniref:anaerobic sulfite reductase subunit AsrA n=1 Tax=Fusobacterium sp. SYSU M8D902 TaxID=3159562 RepID=UPI0032E4F744